LVGDVIDHVPKLGERAAYAKQEIRDKLIDHREYIRRYGDDLPEIKNWTWGGTRSDRTASSTEADNI
jgi:xylulose-5-phosphate/fructose-6-phosphate phosphoketolase